MKLYIFAGYDEITVKNNVTSAIEDFLASKKLGESLYKSDVISVIEDVDGVDRIQLPMDKMARRGETGYNDITALAYEYVRIGTVSYL